MLAVTLNTLHLGQVFSFQKGVYRAEKNTRKSARENFGFTRIFTKISGGEKTPHNKNPNHHTHTKTETCIPALRSTRCVCWGGVYLDINVEK